MKKTAIALILSSLTGFVFSQETQGFMQQKIDQKFNIKIIQISKVSNDDYSLKWDKILNSEFDNKQYDMLSSNFKSNTIYDYNITESTTEIKINNKTRLKISLYSNTNDKDYCSKIETIYLNKVGLNQFCSNGNVSIINTLGDNKYIYSINPLK